MDPERRAQLIEKVRQRYLEDETPLLVSTLMVGPFTSSPWQTQKVVSKNTIITTTTLPNNKQGHEEVRAAKALVELKRRPSGRSIDNFASTGSFEISTEATAISASTTKEGVLVLGTPERQMNGNNTQEINSDTERTLPYNVYDDPDDETVAISSTPP